MSRPKANLSIDKWPDAPYPLRSPDSARPPSEDMRVLIEEGPRSLAILCRRVAVLLDLEHDRPPPHVPRRQFRLTDAPGLRGRERDEPRVFRIAGRR
jgi:hypothetical protein